MVIPQPVYDKLLLKPEDKLPDCPRCSEDELMMPNSFSVACLFCGFIQVFKDEEEIAQ